MKKPRTKDTMVTAHCLEPYTVLAVQSMTVAEAARLGVQRFLEGKSFAEANVLPFGFLASCLKAGRIDLVDALHRGWHTANRAQPFGDGQTVPQAVEDLNQILFS